MVIIDEDIDLDLARKVVQRADYEVIRQRLISQQLRGLRLGGRSVPLFSLSNYTVEEQETFRRLHPVPGGGLRESVTEQAFEMTARRLVIRVTWERPYLGYLLARGVSRHPGTTTEFYIKIQERGEVARLIRNKVATIARNVGLDPTAFSVQFYDLVEEIA